ncbi:UDP-glucuronate 4-epimerase [Marchantia polymorpha subsp. ruderalis]|uniref:NAD-dependent epimerase/dehydratase domain-containing protein n=1 Tax=Marchantia polymorpha TaxID=3197 RepID=A0A2R6WNA3_MARPO|nr:hypothetical protein MARPO_0072s0071 [Marchantia polymorpha]BBN03323.1 hypothetical protein Mp_2g22600 [Marchantia polymorpha subsp. ruderalis]|eukprot:PTQ35328.1 hypothetical protein MARPO_0072s0071 [Marchantia polymorpha]
MVFEGFVEQVRFLSEFECSLYLIILALGVTLVLLLVCGMPLLLREDAHEQSRRDGVQEPAESAPGLWQNQEWQSSVHLSCQLGPNAGDEQHRKMVVIVTGAAGFIGLHVCLALKSRGHGVVGLDNFNTYADFSLKRDRQKVLSKHGVFVINGDINDALLLRKLFDMVPFTHVMHLAAQPSIRYAAENPGAYVHSNIAGLVTLLEACRRANPQPAFIWSSSSSVYGLNTKVPYSEEDRCDQPATLYAASKKAGEGFVHIYNHTHGLSTTTLRLGTVYGPWGRPDMAYWIFTKNILRGKEITIYEGPNNADLARDWTYIDDIVQGCLRAMETAQKSTGSGGRKMAPAQCRTYNLGCNNPVTLPTLISILELNLQVQARIRTVELPPNCNSPFMYSSVSLARAELGYDPSTGPEVGLKKFVDWYREYNGLPECNSCLTESSCLPEPS